MSISSYSIIIILVIILITLAFYLLKRKKEPYLPMNQRFIPDPSVTKFFPVKDDIYENLRLDAGVCVASDGNEPSICSQGEPSEPWNKDVAVLACRGPKRDKDGNIILCDFKSPMLQDDFLSKQYCVTKMPGVLEAGNGSVFSEAELEPTICSQALNANPSNRLNIVEMVHLAQLSKGSGYPDVDNIIFDTWSHNNGKGLQLIVDIKNGEVVRWRVAEMGFGYKVGDEIILLGGNNDASWKVIRVNVFPSVFSKGSKNIVIPDHVIDEDPKELIKYLYNPHGLERLDADKAFKNACAAACTNGDDRCYNNCFRRHVAKKLY